MDRKKELKYLLLIIVVFIAACIETDIYLPAFPDMMKWFSATEGEIQSLLTWNFIGICISGPFYGPFSDSFGRKKPLLIALGIFLIGSLITLFAYNLDQMLWGRILQGVGSGGCFTLGTAIIFDAFQKERAISALNNLNTIIPLIMSAAPMAGGYLNHTFGFRSNFLTIAFFVLFSLIVSTFFFKETLSKEKRALFNGRKIFADFKEAIFNRPLWQLTIVISLIFAGYISFLSGSSVLFVVDFGMSKKIFPFLQAAILFGWVCGSLLLNRMIRKWGIPKVKKIGIILCVVGGVCLGLTSLITPRDPYILTTWMVLYAFGANWVIGLYFPEAMELLPHIKGVVASLLSSIRLLIAAVVVGITASLYNSTVYPLVGLIIITLLMIVPMLLSYEKNSNLVALDKKT